MRAGVSITSCVASDDQALKAVLEALLEIVVQQNILFFRNHPNTPCCLDCGTIKYREPAMADSLTFATAEDILATGYAGCAGAAAYETAKARMDGKSAKVELLVTAPRDFHAVVRYADGSTHDPSLELPKA